MIVTSPVGPFLPVGDRQLSKAQRPVLRFAPELAASECRVVVISARCLAGDDPQRHKTLAEDPGRVIWRSYTKAVIARSFLTRQMVES
jgi:hypothetical protein